DANLTAPLTDFTTGTGGASINWGDGTAATAGTVTQPGGVGTAFIVSGSHTYAEEGSYTVTISITDKGGSTKSTTATATVADAALTATGTAVGATEGNSFSGQVTNFTDANPTAPLTDFTTGTGGASINWGDGTSATSGTVTQPGGSGTAFIVSGSHTYAEEGSYTVTISITDKGGSTKSTTATATVADAALTATGTAVGATEGNSFSGQVTNFTDANPTAPLTDFTTGTGGASINWGDGTSATTGTVTQPGGSGTAFIVSGSHTYAEEGSYTVTISITDKGGSTKSATA